MQFDETMVALMGCVMVFSIPLSVIWTTHRRKVLELQLRLRNQGDVNVNAQLEALRQEVRQLRETATQYDLAFDSALERMENRVEGLERRVQSVEGGVSNEVQIGR